MTPIERAAQALHIEECRAHGVTAPDWSTVADGRKEMFRDQARAVLTAIREPSEAMVKAGVLAPNYLEDQSSARGCGNIYAAMIDAALVEGAR